MSIIQKIITLVFVLGPLACSSDSSLDNSLRLSLVSGLDRTPEAAIKVVLHDNQGAILGTAESDRNGTVSFYKDDPHYTFSVINPYLTSYGFIFTYVDIPRGKYTVGIVPESRNSCPTVNLTFSDSSGSTVVNLSAVTSSYFGSTNGFSDASLRVCNQQSDGNISALAIQKNGLYGFTLDHPVSGDAIDMNIVLDRNVQKLERVIDPGLTIVDENLFGVYKDAYYKIAYHETGDLFLHVADDFPVSRYAYRLDSSYGNESLDYISYFYELPAQIVIPDIGFHFESYDFNGSTVSWRRSDNLTTKYHILNLNTTGNYFWRVVAPGDANHFTLPNLPDEMIPVDIGPIGSLTSYTIGAVSSSSQLPYPQGLFHYLEEEEVTEIIKSIRGYTNI